MWDTSIISCISHMGILIKIKTNKIIVNMEINENRLRLFDTKSVEEEHEKINLSEMEHLNSGFIINDAYINAADEILGNKRYRNETESTKIPQESVILKDQKKSLFLIQNQKGKAINVESLKKLIDIDMKDWQLKTKITACDMWENVALPKDIPDNRQLGLMSGICAWCKDYSRNSGKTIGNLPNHVRGCASKIDIYRKRIIEMENNAIEIDSIMRQIVLPNQVMEKIVRNVDNMLPAEKNFECDKEGLLYALNASKWLSTASIIAESSNLLCGNILDKDALLESLEIKKEGPFRNNSEAIKQMINELTGKKIIKIHPNSQKQFITIPARYFYIENGKMEIPNNEEKEWFAKYMRNGEARYFILSKN